MRRRPIEAAVALELVLITGMSGSGKSVALRALEDAGYFCVDNLPPELLLSFVALEEGHGATRVAIAMDVRSATSLPMVPGQLRELQERGILLRSLFLDSTTDTLVRRFSESRRPHPLAAAGRELKDAIAEERRVLAWLAEIGQRIAAIIGPHVAPAHRRQQPVAARSVGESAADADFARRGSRTLIHAAEQKRAANALPVHVAVPGRGIGIAREAAVEATRRQLPRSQTGLDQRAQILAVPRPIGPLLAEEAPPLDLGREVIAGGIEHRRLLLVAIIVSPEETGQLDRVDRPPARHTTIADEPRAGAVDIFVVVEPPVEIDAQAVAHRDRRVDDQIGAAIVPAVELHARDRPILARNRARALGRVARHLVKRSRRGKLEP